MEINEGLKNALSPLISDACGGSFQKTTSFHSTKIEIFVLPTKDYSFLKIFPNGNCYLFKEIDFEDYQIDFFKK